MANGAHVSLSEEEIQGYILRRLGAGIIDVELTEDHLDDILNDTKRWFSHRVGYRKVVQIPLTTNQSLYILDPDIIEVTRLWLPTTHFPAVDTDDFSFTYSLLFGQWRSPGASPLPYSDLVQRLQYLETASRIFSADREFIFDSRTKELEIMPRPSIVGNMLVETWSTNIETRDLVPEDTSLYLRYAVAHAKEILGEIRNKWSEIPMVGGDRGLNGEKLLAEAKEEKEQIEQDVINWKIPTRLISG